MMRSCFALALVMLVSVGVLGCGAKGGLEGTVPVTGTLKQKGAPLEGATVTFVAVTKGVRAASGVTDASGQFKLTTLQSGDGAFPGDFKVIVTKTEVVGKVYTSEEANAYYTQNKTRPPAPEFKDLVDKKYGNTETSGLKATVKQGEANDFTFEIE